MAVVIIMVLLVFGLGIVGNLFSTLNPFVEKLGNITNYNVAYYAAAMSAERGLLALRYHDAGFEGQSGIKSGHNSDVLVNTLNFGKFTAPTSDSYWKITSMVSRSPELGKGNVEALYAGTDSKNYNVLGYNETIYIPLYKDTTSSTGGYYTGGATESLFDGSGITPKIIGTFRLPAGVRDAFITQGGGGGGQALLDDGTPANTYGDGDIDEDGIDDDIILQRGVEGYNEGKKFTIQPTIKNSFNEKKPEYNYDNAIRETIINDVPKNGGELIDSTVNTFSFLADDSNGSDIDKHNILPLNSTFSGDSFTDILKNKSNDTTGLTLSFSITNLMKTKENLTYPFLEWYFKTADDAVGPIRMPDRFYTLDAVGTINNYTVHFLIKKPVKENSNVSNFTIIF